MRSVKYFVAASLDGFIAGPNGEIDWLFQDGDYGMSAFFRSVDTVFMGRKTHDFGIEHGMPYYAGMKNYVFTRSGRTAESADVEYVSGDPTPIVEQLRQQPGKDMWLVGGGSLAASFFENGLVDEVLVAVHPVILGSGIPLVQSERLRVMLKLLSVKQYDDGLVALSYRVQKPA